MSRVTDEAKEARGPRLTPFKIPWPGRKRRERESRRLRDESLDRATAREIIARCYEVRAEYHRRSGKWPPALWPMGHQAELVEILKRRR